MIPRTYYGWTDNGKFYLSVFPPESKSRPCNEYPDKEYAEAEAVRRKAIIKWQT